MNLSYSNRGKLFRDSFDYIKEVWQDYPMFDNSFGSPYGGIDMLPKPLAKKVPMLITGASQQDSNWLATNGEGWITYPRDPMYQSRFVELCRENAKEMGEPNKPISQSLYIDLVDDKDAKPKPIHLGYRLGTKHLLAHLKALEEVGVNHVALNLRFNQVNIEKTLNRLAKDILPNFS